MMRFKIINFGAIIEVEVTTVEPAPDPDSLALLPREADARVIQFISIMAFVITDGDLERTMNALLESRGAANPIDFCAQTISRALADDEPELVDKALANQDSGNPTKDHPLLTAPPSQLPIRRGETREAVTRSPEVISQRNYLTRVIGYVLASGDEALANRAQNYADAGGDISTLQYIARYLGFIQGDGKIGLVKAAESFAADGPDHQVIDRFLGYVLADGDLVLIQKALEYAATGPDHLHLPRLLSYIFTHGDPCRLQNVQNKIVTLNTTLEALQNLPCTQDMHLLAPGES